MERVLFSEDGGVGVAKVASAQEGSVPENWQTPVSAGLATGLVATVLIWLGAKTWLGRRLRLGEIAGTLFAGGALGVAAGFILSMRSPAVPGYATVPGSLGYKTNEKLLKELEFTLGAISYIDPDNRRPEDEAWWRTADYIMRKDNIRKDPNFVALMLKKAGGSAGDSRATFWLRLLEKHRPDLFTLPDSGNLSAENSLLARRDYTILRSQQMRVVSGREVEGPAVSPDNVVESLYWSARKEDKRCGRRDQQKRWRRDERRPGRCSTKDGIRPT